MTIDTNSIEFAKAVAAEVEKRVAEEVSKIKGIQQIGFKTTMNIDDIKDYHNMLEAGANLNEISKGLLIEVDTLKKFTPEIVDKIKEAKRLALNKMLSKGSTIPVSEVSGSDPKPNLTKRQQEKQDKDK